MPGAGSSATPPPRGYRMPAEWEPHAATWIAWPHNRGDWPGKFAPIPWVYGEIVRHLCASEMVRSIARDTAHEAAIRRVLKAAHADSSAVEIHRIATNRSWLRDSGPIILTGTGKPGRPGRLALDFRFNAWAKYDDWKTDDKVAAAIARAVGVETAQPVIGNPPRRAVLEGGSIDVDGAGTILTTEECLLSSVQERNPSCTRADYEKLFAQWLGAKRTVWLGRGIAGDDTHGHVDDISRFVAPGVVVSAVEPDRADPNHEPLAENIRRLRAARLEVVELPMPRPLYCKGQRIPASYANFYIGNSVVLVPTFNDPADRVALGIIADLFPGRTTVGIHAVDLVWGLGTLHCLTQQEPA